MNAMTYGQLTVTGGLEICTLQDFQMCVTENQHATAHYRGIIESEQAISGLQKQIQGSRVQVSSEGKSIFCGVIQALTITEENGYYEVECKLISGSVLLDQKPKSRSFQDITMTYGEVIAQVIADTDNSSCTMEMGEDVPIGYSIIQYRETDWEFIRRLASHFHTSIYPEHTSGRPLIGFGVPEGRETSIEEVTEYSIHIGKKYYELESDGKEYSRQDFLSYHVKSPMICKIGEKIRVNHHLTTICRMRCSLINGELIYTYQAGQKLLVSQKKEYNSKIIGMSIFGTVLETERETLKIHLDIDESQDPSCAYSYEWVPPSGNLMYLMPKTGTRVSLYIGSEDEKDAEANSCVRTNGGSQCTEMGDYNKRYLRTEHAKQLSILPEEIGFTGTGSPTMSLNVFMNDEDGIVIQSHMKIQMTSLEEFHFEAPLVTFSSASEFTASRVVATDMQQGAESYAVATVDPVATLNLEFSSQQNLVGENMLYCGWEFISYPPFDDAPKEGSISWGKLLLGVVAGIAAVVVVTALVATGAIFVCGALALTAAATSAVVTGAIVGGAVVGGLYVGMQAYKDIDSGNASDVGTYVKEGAIGGTVGAVSGAFTPVLGPISTPIVNGVVGGSAYAGEWAFRNAIGEKEPWSWTSFGMNVGLSAAGGSIGRAFSNRATTKALASVGDDAVNAATTKTGMFTKLMSSDFVTSIYSSGNKTGAYLANSIGGEAGEAALKQIGNKANTAILNGITGGNQELTRKLIAEDDYFKFRGGNNLEKTLGDQGIQVRGVDLDEGTWDLGPFPRGQAIDEKLGNNLGSNYPVVDKIDENGIITSIKSKDLVNSNTYQKPSGLESSIKSDINKLDGFNGRNWGGINIEQGDIKGKVLEVVIPDAPLTSAQIEAIKNAVDYGDSLGIDVIITIGR